MIITIINRALGQGTSPPHEALSIMLTLLVADGSTPPAVQAFNSANDCHGIILGESPCSGVLQTIQRMVLSMLFCRQNVPSHYAKLDIALLDGPGPVDSPAWSQASVTGTMLPSAAIQLSHANS